MVTRGFGMAMVAAAGLIAAPGCDQKPGSGATPGGGSAAGAGTGATSDANAADVYVASTDRFGKELLDAVAKDQSADALLVAHAADIEALVDATKLERCDFGTDWSQGLNAMMPHLGKVRGLARVLRADTSRLLAAGDADGAAKRIAAMLRMANQVGRGGRTTIELLVAAAVGAMAAEFITANPALAKAAWKTDIQQAIVEVERDGVLNSPAIIGAELELTSTSLRQNKVPDMSSMGGKNWPMIDQAERDAAASKLEAMRNDVIAAWSAPDAVSRLATLAGRAKQEGVGDLFTAYDKARTAVDRLRDSLRRASAALAS